MTMSQARPPMVVLRPKGESQTPGSLGKIWFSIVIVALLVRVMFLGQIPPSLFRDEAEKALNALSLLQTGQDLEGHAWPIFVKAFGVTTSAIYQYLTIPVFALFGPSDWSSRLVAALIGTLAVAVTPWALRPFLGIRLALVIAMALALSPWHLPLSRWAQQGIFLPFFALLLLGSWKRWTLGWTPGLPISGIICGLAIYTYDPARLIFPLFLLGLLTLSFKHLRAKPTLVLLFLLALGLACLPTLWLLFTQSEAAQARFHAISIFNQPLPGAILQGLQNYFHHFSPLFLMVSGDAELRHGVGVGGVLGPLLGVGFYWGFVLIVFRPKLRKRLTPLAIIVLLTPAAASLTREGIPHALRSQVGVPFLIALALVGWRDLIRRIPAPSVQTLLKKTSLALVLSGIVLNSSPFLTRYFGSYARHSAFSWQYGIKEGLFQAAPARELQIPLITCWITGDSVLVQWYEKILLREGRLPQDSPPFQWSSPFFGASPAEIDHQRQGQPAVYLALPGLTPVPGGVLLPVWYQGFGSSQGDNPTLIEVHINPAALQLIRSAVPPSNSDQFPDREE